MAEHTREEVAIALLELVGRKGEDFVYKMHDSAPACTYADGSSPDCGIGEILHVDFGIPVPYLAAIDRGEIPVLEDETNDDFAATIGHPRVQGYLSAIGVEFTPAATLLMRSFQGLQDQGVRYGDIVRRLRLR